MRNEEKAGVLHLFSKTPVVQSGNDCFPRARRRNNQVAESLVSFALNCKALEDLPLMWKRNDVDRSNLKRIRRISGCDCPIEALAVPRRIVGLEIRLFPITVEGCSKLI